MHLNNNLNLNIDNFNNLNFNLNLNKFNILNFNLNLNKFNIYINIVPNRLYGRI